MQGEGERTKIGSEARRMRRDDGRGARTGNGPVKIWLNMLVRRSRPSTAP